eukprot:14680352-Alexandrium_andersonii.AAC.1
MHRCLSWTSDDTCKLPASMLEDTGGFAAGHRPKMATTCAQTELIGPGPTAGVFRAWARMLAKLCALRVHRRVAMLQTHGKCAPDTGKP